MSRSKLEKMLNLNRRQKSFYEEDDAALEEKGNLPTRLWRTVRRRQQAIRRNIGVDREINRLHREWMGELTGKSVLDLGCHSGNPLSLYLARESGSYLGVDLSESAIAELSEKIAPWDHARAEAVDFLSPEFPDRSFDVVYARSVFHHFEYFEVFLEKLERHLEPGAVVITYDPLKTSPLIRTLRTLYRPFQSDAEWEYPFGRETFKTIDRHFEITGIRGVMGAAKWAIPLGLVHLGLGSAVGKKLAALDKERTNSLNSSLWRCMLVTMRLRPRRS